MSQRRVIRPGDLVLPLPLAGKVIISYYSPPRYFLSDGTPLRPAPAEEEVPAKHDAPVNHSEPAPQTTANNSEQDYDEPVAG